MTEKKRLYFVIGILLLILFIGLTIAVATFDVQPIGVEGTSVGFASLNKSFHELTGEHLSLYDLTDKLSLIPAFVLAAFALIGLVQLIRRKSLLKVDSDILVLGVFYIIVLAAYLLFEKLELNYRPLLIEGQKEASYPSSTTLLVVSVVATAMLQFNTRIEKTALRTIVLILSGIFGAAMIICRLISGVHWLTDIIGGLILGAALIFLYEAAVLHFRKTDSARV